MRNVKVTLVVGVVLILAIGALTLTGSPVRTVRVGTYSNAVLTIVSSDTVVCQPKEVLPKGASAVRISVWAFLGSQVQVKAFSGSRVLTEGTRDADWTTNSVTVPVKPIERTTHNVLLCFSLSPNSEPMLIIGSKKTSSGTAVFLGRKTLAPAAVLARTPTKSLNGRVGMAYIASGRSSWWSRSLSVARHIGLGHVLSGTWIALFLAMLMAVVCVLAIRLTLRELS